MLILLFWSIQAIVRSTTHLLASTTNPRGGRSFCQSTHTPSFADSLAHAIRAPPGGRAFGDAPPDPRSSPRSFPPSPPPCPLRGSPTPAKDDGGAGMLHLLPRGASFDPLSKSITFALWTAGL